MLLQKSALPNPGSHHGPDEEGFFGTEQKPRRQRRGF